MSDNGGFAFPNNGDAGMTLRDYFAGQALVGLLVTNNPYLPLGDMATLSYGMADSMLKARKK